MLTLIILSVGLCIVVGGILAWRLPAFIALILAGLVVSALSPASLVQRSLALEKSIRIRSFSVDELQLVTESVPEFERAVVYADDGHGQPLRKLAEVSLSSTAGAEATLPSVGFSIVGAKNVDIAEWPPTTSLLLVSMAESTSADRLGATFFMSRLTSALGEYCGNLAIMIVAASVIGRCLLDSGAATKIVSSTLSVLGERLAPAAFGLSGFVLAIPVFFDTVFYLMVPLAKAMRLKSSGNYLLYVMSIVAGGTMAHSLVPPTPGPLFIAAEFGVPMPTMIVGGCVIGLFATGAGMIYAIWINRRYDLPLKDLPELNETLKDRPLPGLLTSLLPILLPVVLISMSPMLSISGTDGASFAGIAISSNIAYLLKSLTDQNMALLISACAAILIYVRTQKPTSVQLSDALQHAITSAGVIILVTAAGGAFGRMMRQASVAEYLRDLPGTSPVIVILAAFFVTAAVRTAQGSATVAMFTSAGIFGGIVTSGAAGVDPLYAALAVGCGSKPFSWMNDSGFWVITRMSGMTEREGLRYVTPLTGIAGLAGLVGILIVMSIFPQNPIDSLIKGSLSWL